LQTRCLTADDVTTLRAMLDLFGDVFDDRPAHIDAQPPDEFLRERLATCVSTFRLPVEWAVALRRRDMLEPGEPAAATAADGLLTRINQEPACASAYSPGAATPRASMQ
jgi:hypothetical protein